MMSRIGAVLVSGLAIWMYSLTLADTKQLAIVIGNDPYAEVLAIAAGDPAANSRLGGMYVNGTGVRKNVAKACELFRTAAAMGNANGATNARRFCGR